MPRLFVPSGSGLAKSTPVVEGPRLQVGLKYLKRQRGREGPQQRRADPRTLMIGVDKKRSHLPVKQADEPRNAGLIRNEGLNLGQVVVADIVALGLDELLFKRRFSRTNCGLPTGQEAA